MKKTTKRLKLNIETLRALDLHEVTGGTFTFTFTAASKPNASCFIQCTPTNNCPITQTCPLATAAC
jgi:hypothetical protein